MFRKRLQKKITELTREVATSRVVTFADEQLIELAATAWVNWQDAIKRIADDGLLHTEFGDDVVRLKKHPAVDCERQFHAEYVARLYDLQVVTKEKKAKRKIGDTGEPNETASTDPLNGLRLYGDRKPAC